MRIRFFILNALSILWIVSASAMAEAYGLCVDSVDRLNTSASQLNTQSFCTCIEETAGSNSNVRTELKANNGFPPPDKASDALKAAVQSCRKA